MLSLETAKSLKEAGLKWEPKMGDLFVADYDNGLGPTPVDVVKTNNFGEPGPEHIWLPRLDQLLAEIEKHHIGGYTHGRDLRGYFTIVTVVNTRGYGLSRYEARHNDSPEEAAAQALLWILKEG
jgi:hypothetical protein